MSFIVTGMEMPANCADCVAISDGLSFCRVSKNEICNQFPIFDGRPSFCPLRPLPEKHGRLVDADELEGAGYALSKLHINTDAQDSKQMVWRELVPFDEAPTIVEAEGD